MDNKKSRVVKIIGFTLAVLFAAGYLVFELFGDKLSGVVSGGELIMGKTGVSFRYDTGSKASFFACADSGIFFCTKDGIKYIESNGSEKMSSTFSFVSPVLIGEGSCAAVYEQKGKTVNVYGKKGLLYTKSMENPVLAVSINPSGYSSIITQGEQNYEICLYNNEGIALIKYVHNEPYSFPVASDVSDDGRILAVSYFDFGEVEVSSKLVFTYSNPTEFMNYKDGIFASVVDKGEYVGLVRFADGNRLLTVSDKTITLIDVENGCSRPWILTSGNRLDDICFIGSKAFAIALGTPLANLQSDPSGTVKVYDLSLNLTASVKTGGQTASLSSGFGSLVINSAQKLVAVSSDGKILWSYNPEEDVTQAMFVDNTQNLIIASQSGAYMLRLDKPAGTEEAK